MKEKSLNPDEFVRTTDLGKAELKSCGEGGEIVGDDCGMDDDDDDNDEVRS